MSLETENLVMAVLASGWTKALLSNRMAVPWDEIDAWVGGTSEPTLAQVALLGELLRNKNA